MAPSTSSPSALRSQCSRSFAPLLRELGGSLIVSTYQSGRVVLLRDGGGEALNTHYRAFAGPMGMAFGPHGLAIGEQSRILFHVDMPGFAAQMAGEHLADACFMPRRAHVTGDVRVHELAWVGDNLVFVNTRFSCLATPDDRHSFVPVWKPPFVSDLVAEDRCHLNGLCVEGGAVRYVTALGRSDRAEGWRERRLDGGVLLSVPDGEVVSDALCMPHSPRWHGGRLWLLDSGRGALQVVDPANGQRETVAQVPGFARGLAFAGPYAFIGLSQVRESIFDGLPLPPEAAERVCGVWVVDTRSGQTVALVRFLGEVQEIFDVQWLPGLRCPDLIEFDAVEAATAFSFPAPTQV